MAQDVSASATAVVVAKPSAKDGETSTFQNSNAIGQFCEALVLAGLAFLLCGLFLREIFGWPLLFAVFVLTTVAFAIAVEASRTTLRMAEREAEEAKFRITAARLETLRVQGTPPDVVLILREIEDEGKTYSGEKEFLRVLEDTLGRERAHDVKSVVFRYTRF